MADRPRKRQHVVAAHRSACHGTSRSTARNYEVNDIQPQHIAVIGNNAASLINFRGSLVRSLVGKGIRVSALAPDYDATTRAEVVALGAEPVGFSLDRTGMHVGRDLRDIYGLWRSLRQLRPDAMLTYFMKPNIYGTIAGVLARIPRRVAMIEGLGYVFTQSDGSTGRKRRLLRWLTSKLYKWSLRFSDKVVLLNDDDVAFFVGGGLLCPGKVIRLDGIGVDLRDFTGPPPPAGGALRFLMVARLLREKGVAEYLAAAARVSRRYPDARFALVGGPDPNPGGFPEEDVRRAVADGYVAWPGAVADVRPWIAESDVFVLPSYREGMPRSTQEAMAMSRPVITTDAPGCRDTVVQGVNGLLVPVRSVDALVDAMAWFIEHRDAVERMGRASRTLAEQRFDVEDKDRVLLAALTELAPAKRVDPL